MKEKIDELLEKYRCFLSMARISKNGCDDDDYIYNSYLLGKMTTIEEIIKDLENLEDRK